MLFWNIRHHQSSSIYKLTISGRTTIEEGGRTVNTSTFYIITRRGDELLDNWDYTEDELRPRLCYLRMQRVMIRNNIAVGG